MTMNLEESLAFCDKALDSTGNFPLTTDVDVAKEAARCIAREGNDFAAMDAFTALLERREKAANDKAATGFKTTPCTITESQFAASAPESLGLRIFGEQVKSVKKYGKPRANKSGGESGGRFESGAFGYWFGGRVTLNIEGEDVAFQVGGTLVAINSAKVAKID